MSDKDRSNIDLGIKRAESLAQEDQLPSEHAKPDAQLPAGGAPPQSQPSSESLEPNVQPPANLVPQQSPSASQDAKPNISQPESEISSKESPVDSDNSNAPKTLTENERTEQLRTLKNKQTYALCCVTKKRNELSKYMTNDANLHLVKSCIEDYNELFLHYQSCYNEHCEMIIDENDRDNECTRYENKESSIINFRNQVQEWIGNAERRLLDDLDRTSSTSSSSYRTHHSRRSRNSISSKVSDRAKAKVKLAELLVEKSMLKEQLQVQELRLNMEIAKTQAREKVLAEVESTNSVDPVPATSDTVPSTQPIEPPAPQSNAASDTPPATGLQSRDAPVIQSPTDTQPVQQSSVPVVQAQSNMQTHNKASVLDPKVQEFYPHGLCANKASSNNTNVHQQIMDMQRQQNAQILATHQQIATAMSLPMPEVPKFTGDPMDYNTFHLAFEARIVSRTSSNVDRLYYLQQHLEGEPKDLIGGCMYMDPEDGYKEAWLLLQREYGDLHKISTAYINKVLGWTPIKHDDSPALKQFSFFLIKCLNAMKSICHMTVLNHNPNLQAILLKLPTYLQNKWRDYVTKLKRQEHRIPQFDDLVSFIETAAESANDPVFSKEALHKLDKGSAKSKEPYIKHQTTSFAVNLNDSDRENDTTGIGTASTSVQHTVEYKQRCPYCTEYHDLDNCDTFCHKSIDEKRSFIKDNHMCYGCFGFNHVSKGCIKKKTCRKCNKRHPTALHIDGFTFARKHDVREDSVGPNAKGNTRLHVPSNTCNATQSTTSSVIFHAILPVKVFYKDNKEPKTTYAFYDHGSSGCFISEDLKEELGAVGVDTTLQLRTMHGQSYINTTAINDVVVSDIQGNNKIQLPKTYTRVDIPVSREQIPKPELLRQWHHLKEIANQVPEYMPDVEIGLLIGSNCPAALQALKVIPVEGDGPFAALFRHGWTINGPLHVNMAPEANITTCNHIAIRETENAKEVISAQAVLKMFDMDFNGCHDGKVPGERGHSQEDLKFLQKATNEIQLINGHYVLPLPFRDANTMMPNNKGQAIKRALWQKKKMLRNKQYQEEYATFVNDVIQKGYAQKVPSTQLEVAAGKVWYLPHHAVYHPKKPGKVRVVFDCSASYLGVSLNDKLLQGPDLTNSLVGVLTRFRQGPIAIMSDIESMFYQVQVPEEHHDFLRFMWWPDGNLNAELQEYRMKVHLFGAVSSPSISNFALRQIAVDHEAELDQEVVKTIKHHFYVDDCLRSVMTKEDAIQLASDLQSACFEGGFHLTKFTCNDLSVLNTIPKEDHSKQMKSRDLDCDKLPIEHALGIQWSVQSDVFGFSIMLQNKPLTRRGVLSIVSSVYDPLGFVAPFVLPAKKILQDLCRERSLGWDDDIPDEYLKRFESWLQEVPLLEHITVQRCLRPVHFGQSLTSQIHVFADASSTGYGSVAYLRLHDGSSAYCSFLIGKARLAPLKTTTIPRLELTAATVAVRIGQMMLQELDIPIDDIIYHTDSTTVLHYINSENKRFPVFVANRVQLIRNFSSPEQWRYVDTTMNPADDASRGLGGRQLKEQTRWLHGPSFLQKPESEWPAQPDLTGTPNEATSMEDDTMINSAAISIQDSQSPTDKLITYYSDWHKLKKATSVFLTVRTILQHRLQNQNNSDSYEPFTMKGLQCAEQALLKYGQEQSFKTEIDALAELPRQGRARKRPTVLKNSPIYRLDPFLHEGIVLVGGRLSNASLPEETKHPTLLPRKSHITTLVIRDVHQRLAHAGRNHVIAAIREKYWIIGINAAVRHYIHKCITCRRLRKPCNEQQMADLPVDRMEPAPPFTCTGIDFFGPFLVKEGRKELKRYGVLFTCLVSRSIHIETANTLETDSFMNALRRFISRRGPVQEIRCDNGTNFVGAERELSKAISELDHENIQQKLLTRQIDWKFNTPAASHMGGVWERQIRTVRKVLAALLLDHGTRLDDESFRTLMCEIEAIVNSRPLTLASSNPDDMEPLTPNHILTMKPVILPPPGNFEDTDLYYRKRWRRIQYLANLFWTRWKREYLLTLQQRQKWNTQQRNIQVGDIVLLKDDSSPRFTWPMGRIISTTQDKKGHVRSVTLKTQSSELRRPIHKLVLLIPEEEQN